MHRASYEDAVCFFQCCRVFVLQIASNERLQFQSVKCCLLGFRMMRAFRVRLRDFIFVFVFLCFCIKLEVEDIQA